MGLRGGGKKTHFLQHVKIIYSKNFSLNIFGLNEVLLNPSHAHSSRLCLWWSWRLSRVAAAETFLSAISSLQKKFADPSTTCAPVQSHSIRFLSPTQSRTWPYSFYPMLHHQLFPATQLLLLAYQRAISPILN